MAKQCPKCGRRFPDNANHCDRDGFDLIAASGKTPSFGSLGIWAVAAVVIGGSLGVIGRAYLRSSIRIAIPEDARIELRLEKGAPTLLFDLALTNSSLVSIHLRDIQYRVRLGPKDELTGSKDAPLDIPAGASLRIPVRLVSADKALLTTAQAFAAAGTSQSVTIQANLSVCMLRCFTVPLQSFAPVNFVNVTPPVALNPPANPPGLKPANANPPRGPASTNPEPRKGPQPSHKKGHGKL